MSGSTEHSRAARPRVLGGFRRKGALVATALATIGGAFVWGAASGSAGAATPGDGTSSTTAGASCWGIKQQFPTSADGSYWLLTPDLGAPQQFYCDMTTDGGGWVLVGRGRSGWKFGPDGQGSKTTLRTTIDGTGAFTPAALPTKTIDALLGGTALKDLPDGVRFRRARSEDGSQREDWRLKFSTRTSWTWGFGGAWPLASTTVDGTTYADGNSRDSAISHNGHVAAGLSGRNDYRFISMTLGSSRQPGGFFQGLNIRGSNSATTFIYNMDGTYGATFTQVWIRPKLTSFTWPAIPGQGLPAQSSPAGLSNRAQDIGWGVTGYNRTNEERIEPYNTYVMDIDNLGNKVYVAGRFAQVQHGANGEIVAQPFLAAFDQRTGEFDRGFRPQIDGRVWDVINAPNGKIIIGGDFTNVNGVANTQGLAMLDPNTGAVDTTWKATVARVDNTGYRAVVRAMDIQDGALYVVGNFNRFTGGTWNTVSVTRAVKVNLTNGSPIRAWGPRFTASPVDIDVSSHGDRVYTVGFFATVNSVNTSPYVAVVDTNTGALVPGLQPWHGEAVYGDRYQQTALEYGDRVYIGGAEHILQAFNRNDFARVQAGTASRGGDFQESNIIGGKLYASCHCGDYWFRGTRSWGGTPPSFIEGNRINYVGAFDPNDLTQDTTFLPDLAGTGDGVFAIEGDSDGCAWFGGNVDGVGGRWAGGFARYCPKDTTPPPTPTNLKATTTGSNIKLTWTASEAGARYWVYRDDRPVAETYGTSWTDTGVTGIHQYWVAAVDPSDNRSATTAGVAAGPQGPAAVPIVPSGSNWRWSTGTNQTNRNWTLPGFNDAAWAQGPAQLGWGDGDEATVIPSGSITSYFRSTFTVADPAALRSVVLGLVRDDSAVVYINGVEVMRSNLPDGAIAADTPAVEYISGSGETTPVTAVIPSSLLVAGTNTVAVELHQKGAGNGDASFDLAVVPSQAQTDATAPSAVTVSAQATGDTAVTLQWNQATDNVGIAGYLVLRNGQPWRVVGPTVTTVLDGGLAPGSAADYSVVAFDAAGNRGTGNQVHAGPSGAVPVLNMGSQWRWSYPATAPDPTWAQPAFNDGAWTLGAGQFGYGDGDEATVLSTAAAPRPETSYFRTTVNIANPAAFSNFVISAIRDDGIVVYVNGVEVGRDNMPAGPITNATVATAALDTTAQERTPVSFTVPAARFVAGNNTIAVEVHNIHRWSGDMSFDASIAAKP